jgi:rifamycin polyketide synthase module 1/2/3
VVGVPLETLGEVPVAFVAWLVWPVAADLMLEHCRRLLAAYKIPAELRSVEEIPRTGSGKVVRFRLRDAYVAESSPEGAPSHPGARG